MKEAKVHRLRPSVIADEVFAMVFQHLAERYPWLPSNTQAPVAHEAAVAVRLALQNVRKEHGGLMLERPGLKNKIG